MLLRNRYSTVRLFLIAICFTSALPIHYAMSAEVTEAAKKIRVAIYADAGATPKDVPQVERCLPASQGFEVKPITAEQIRGGALKDFDVLIHPGGSASKQAESLGEKGRDSIRHFVTDGGGFIGICAGAYLGSAEYPWSLHLLDAHVIDGKHWARGQGDVKLRLTSVGQSALQSEKEICSIHFENGPLLGPGKKDDIEDYEQLAAFETEIRENNAPPGIMKGATAIARGKYGKGHVVCFSPHPEKTPGREPFLQSATRWVARSQNGETK